MVLHLFCKQRSLDSQCWLSICYTVTRTVSWTTTPFILPDPYVIPNVLLVSRKVEDWRCLNLTCVAADTRDECHQMPRVETGWQGKWKMVRVGGICTHNRLSCCKKWRAPTSQMRLCQRQPGIPEGVFQWWWYPCRISTGRRREWVSVELATLYSHTDASLWVSHISWDHFLTTVQLTDFYHRGSAFDIFFLCYILCKIWTLWLGVGVVSPAWEAQRHNH